MAPEAYHPRKDAQAMQRKLGSACNNRLAGHADPLLLIFYPDELSELLEKLFWHSNDDISAIAAISQFCPELRTELLKRMQRIYRKVVLSAEADGSYHDQFETIQKIGMAIRKDGRVHTILTDMFRKFDQQATSLAN